MLETVGLFVLGLVLLALGGDSIIKGASGLARHFGLSPLVAGLLLVAFGTSLPELAINLQAIARGQSELALGNAVGSNIVNFGLTLGAAALAAPLLVQWRALSPLLLCLMGGTAVTIVLGWDGRLGRIDGWVMLAAFFAVVALAIARTRDESVQLTQRLEAFTHTGSDLGLNLVRFGIAVVLLYFGSRWVVGSAPAIGERFGLLPLMTGLLPVAIGSALPEVAAAVMAARRGQGDMVVGHVIGSSLFNLLLIVGGMAAWSTLALPVTFVRFELPASLVLALMLYPMLRGDLAVSRREGGILLVAFVAWVGYELLTLG